jgi:photosystem II stability/assembly factor-like uncharacterized protein
MNRKDTGVSLYKWYNAAIGGGGYVTGIVYSRVQENLIYARTDIGGAYRRNGQCWYPLTDCLGGQEWNLIGIESIAADPIEAGRVYLMAGTYMDRNGALLRSDDYGKSWERTKLQFPCGANCSGRGVGERLAVNPRDNRQLYMGTRNAGLWKSEDYGRSWNRVESFPAVGDYIQENNPIGVMWVLFHPLTGEVYAGVAETSGKCIFRSGDGGKSWEALPVNLSGMYPLRADFSANGTLCLAYSDNCGPNLSPTAGAVCKFDGEHFTDITPPPDGRIGGFGGISVDAQNPEALMVSTLGCWSYSGDNLYRSADGGKSWTGIFSPDTGEKRCTVNAGSADWLRWGREEAQTGWWISDVKINPFRSDEAMYGTGAAVCRAENLLRLGKGEAVGISFAAHGMEETAVYKLISPHYCEGEPVLYSIIGDLTGFSHLNITVPPDSAHFMGAASGGNPTDMDVAHNAADIAVYAVENAGHPLWYTRSGGADWQPLSGLPVQAAGGKLAVSADGRYLLWVPAGCVEVYRFCFESSLWCRSSIPDGCTAIAADKVNPMRFYAICSGSFYASQNGGADFAPTGAAAEGSIFPVPDREGHIWVCSDSGIFRSADGGQHFILTKEHFSTVGFGAPAHTGDYPIAYAMGRGSAQGSIYSSRNGGESWERINDAQHLFGNLTPSITGDGRISGRVYLATNGRGIVVGDISE